MSSPYCPGPIWDGLDFNPCFNEVYIQSLLPLSLLAISIALLFQPIFGFVRRLVKRSRQFNILLHGDDTLTIVPSRTSSIADDEHLYRLNTTESSAEYSEGVTPTELASPEVGAVQDNDVDIVFLRPRNVRLRAALEHIFLLGLIAVHTVAIAISIFYHPGDDRFHLSTAHLISIGFWTYALVLAVGKNSRFIMDVPPAFWSHSSILYFTQWLVSIIQIHSIFVVQHDSLYKVVAFFDFVFCLSLWTVSLTTPQGRIPGYVETRIGTQPNPEPYASLYEILTLAWMYSLLFKGLKRTLTMDDVWDLSPRFRVKSILTDYRAVEKSSFPMRLFGYCRRDLFYSGLWTVVQAFLSFGPTLLIRAILGYLEDPSSEPRHMAWVYVGLLSVAPLINAVCSVQSQWGFRGIAIRLRELIVGELYAKSLLRNAASLSRDEDHESKDKKAKKENEHDETAPLTTGSIINLMAVDSFVISDACTQVQQLITVVVMLVISFALLFDTLGISAIAAIISMFALVPGNYWTARQFGKTMREMMTLTDQRIQKTNEVLQSIKIIKYFAWEPSFYDVLHGIRKKETEKLRKRYILWSTAGFLWYGFTPTVTFFTFGFYTLVAKEELTATIAFTSIALFSLMRTPMEILVDVFSSIVEASVSMKRIDRFLSEEGTTKYEQLSIQPDANSPYIGFQGASFSWGNGIKEREFKLQNISIDFPVGKLTVVVGPTGSGKTSLLMALLGEMKLLKGEVFLPSRRDGNPPKPDPETGMTDAVAYCAQQPWLLNDSIRNNITFGSRYIESRYKKCVHACALLRDFDILEYGDQTQIGEKGIALSGGQKQRISLARALYSSAKHLLLDDCLSAVDSHSAHWIYEKCILGPMMKGRTCILVSHNVSLTLVGADHVVAIDNGKIKVQGTAAEVYGSGALGEDDGIQNSVSQNSSRIPSRATSSLSLAPKLKSTVQVDEVNENDEPEDLETEILLKSRENPQQIEDSEQGRVSWDVYLTYLRSMGSYSFWALITTIYISQQLVQLAQTVWLREWTNDLPDEGIQQVNANASSHRSSSYYLWVYGLASIAYIVISILRIFVIMMGVVRASKRLFKLLLQSVLRATPRFFDTTPVGRILNRFSKDIETIDMNVGPDVYSIGHTTLLLLFVVITISFVFPAFLIAGAVIGIIYAGFTACYLSSARDLRRINSVTRSPIYQHFGETLAGLSTIRAYGCEKRFVEGNIERLEYNTRPYWTFWGLMCWLMLRAELIGGAVLAVTSGFLVSSVDKIDAGLAGLCLTYAITFGQTTMWFVTSYTNIEMNMNSVERVKEYMNLESEAPDVIDESRPPADWPDKGAISVEHLTLRYAPELPKVIDDISFDVKPRWKVGIVGRTGAGKSTIAGAFFRFLEAETGSISIDGIDIAKIGLRDLRTGLAIIPQDPTLFTGTIRSNLDPFDMYADIDIFQALRRVKLIDTTPLPAGELTEEQKSNVFYNLGSPVTEGGGNLSQGQRQLVCLARSLLKSPRVIILDEATASIDYETDAQIQLTIRQEFSQSTILTIAHRLRSIIDYDMILVLDSGRVKEYNKPHLLLQDADSIFRSMCESSGELDALEQLAAEAYALQTS
ncbi:P-loop containing nucleoside triphosphate hydrolase protein [Lipomyces tetrasporus]|uniref:P-loop containing nucleoside triphosphate hydrolase protein n=1 Tax=Lipomyces tetrasporus TaxID=54092 RepID=A0AAD7QS52_9ASCO|nr:P-loop containing nucleoside triphosphate hydrolase protein [Lipomyces tetrasporus]KAJ8100519.1 P-loop containing nucleoside triphosphate hydrolase protein [Lipomyces tetrasporus]